VTHLAACSWILRPVIFPAAAAAADTAALSSAQAQIKQGEARAAQLQQQLSEAESRVAAKGEEVDGLQKQLEGVQAELDKTAASLAEKEAKVRYCCSRTCARPGVGNDVCKLVQTHTWQRCCNVLVAATAWTVGLL
jgi:septal ring factor EnvC (AmiA/AmiB activator)